jgi:hypothetical protein
MEQIWPGLDINVCPIPVETDVGQVDLVLRLSYGTYEKIRDSQTCRYDGQIYFHWYNILGLLYELICSGFFLFITTLRTYIQCHIFISVYLDWSLAYQ